MFRAFGPERLSTRLLLVGLLMAGVPSAGYADLGEPGADPGTENLSGPATVGTATIIPAGFGIVSVDLVGVCGSSGVTIDDLIMNFDFNSINAESLVHERFPIVAELAPCYTGLPEGAELIINTVTSFTATDGQIITDLVILAVFTRPVRP